MAAYVGGKRRMASYATYGEAKAVADKLVLELASGSTATALTAKQAAEEFIKSRDHRTIAKSGKRPELSAG